MRLTYDIRSEKLDDYEGIKELNILAFNHKEDEAKLIEHIRESEFFIPELSMVAVKGARDIIGHILFSYISIETAARNIPTLALAPMAVKPEYQNRGIGSELVAKGLDVCKNLGHEHVFVLGHPKFYPNFGFIPAKAFGIKSPFSVPDEAFMACELRNDSLSGIKGTVKYPSSFNKVT
ncbi:GNAT family N-acetyltransferase [Metabacillus arenae]|uniref:N-acetyltransferase n=1 Tax=Metabacillus arenae TaxID=2771434 RepID=A0A926NEX9_9BACI|nr:N-acetyltransferase [Metabacillus arenae]MBD1379575.1 N-acetyltransferase [Metabacillus arenae]